MRIACQPRSDKASSGADAVLRPPYPPRLGTGPEHRVVGRCGDDGIGAA